jgi:hypothetical protein
LSVVALKAKLSLIWKGFSKWGVISLGKGFFEFTFSTLEDVRRVRSIPSWNINPGMLKLFAWSKDFNPRMQHNTYAQVWVKMFGLSQEYWHKNILFTIASSIGTPICIDSVTARPMLERTFGQFARVLVDMDLSQPLRYKVLVERKGFAFFVELEYENVPDFRNACQLIGHHVDNCKRWNKEDEVIHDNEVHKKKNPIVQQKKTYVPTKDGRVTQNKVDENVNIEIEIINVEEDSVPEIPASKAKEVSVLADKSPASSLPKQSAPGPVVCPAFASGAGHRQAASVQVVEPILCPTEIFKAQDQQLEHDLDQNQYQQLQFNDGEKEFSDTDSGESFVDATQNQIGNSSAASDDQRQTPDRVAKDMEFLKSSWANMAEEEEEPQQQLQDQDKVTDDHDEGFTVALSKKQKQAQKKKSHSTRDSYATRSRVSPKPFR